MRRTPKFFYILIAVAVVGIALANFILSTAAKHRADVNTSDSNASTIDIPLKEIHFPKQNAPLQGAGNLTVNGSITAMDTVVLFPSKQPANTSTGQLYYDKDSNTLAYYNGTRYVNLTEAIPPTPNSNTTIDTSGFLRGTNGADGAIAKFAAGSTTLELSLLRESAGTVNLGGNLRVTGQVSLSAPLSVASGGTGTTALQANGVIVANANGSLGALVSTLPNECLMSTGGAPVFAACPGAAGGGVLSLNGLTGTISLANATTSGSTITLNDASTSAKGVARFNSTNFSVSSGLVNTVQDIASTARPNFVGLSVTGQASGTIPALAIAPGAGNSSGITIDTSAIGGMSGNALEVKAPYYGGVTTFQLSDAGDLTLGGVGNGGGATGSITLFNAFSTFSTVLSTPDTGTANRSITLPNGNGTLCLQNSGSTCGYAARGGNSDITSLSGLTTALSVGQGGTGRTTFTANGLLYGNTGSGLLATAAGTTGQCLVGNTGSAPTWGNCAPSNGTAVTSLNLLTGNLTLANASATGATVTIDDASTTQKGIAQFSSTNFSASGGTINTIQNISATADPTFRNLTLATLAIASGQATNPMLLINNTNVSGTGNLLDVQQNGSSRFSVSPAGNAILAGSLTVNSISPTGALTIGSSGQAAVLQGSSTTITVTSGGTTNSLVFATPSGSGKTVTIPNASGTIAVSASGPLSLDANGNLTCAACMTAGGGSGGGAAGVESLNALTGALTIANASTAGTTITLNDSSTTQKGIAQFNSSNFTATSGVINLIQDLHTTASPTFSQLTLTSSQGSAAMLTVNNTNTSATGNLIDMQLNGASRLAVTPAGALTVAGTVNGQTISSAANFTGTLTVGGTLTANTITPTSALTVGATNQAFTVQGSSTSTITATNGANVTSLAFQAPTANVTYRLLTATAGTFDICTSVGNCAGSGGGVTTLGGTAGKIAKFTASGAIGDSILTESSTTVTVGGTLAATTAVQAPLVDAVSGVALNIGTTNATAVNLNQNTVLAASKSFTITGGNTASRPASPSEGAMYYDTTTKALLVYANSKWQSDRSAPNKIVAMGTATGCTGSAPVASQNPDAADFVTTSCTSAQTVINSAITALPASGGTVYLMEGTYIIDGAITLPSNVKLTGAGAGTTLKMKDSAGASVSIISGTTITRSTVSNLRLDGNKANNVSALNQRGIQLTTTSSTTGTATVSDIWIENFNSTNSYGIDFTGPLTISNNYFSGNDSISIFAHGSYFVITSNKIVATAGTAINLQTGNMYSTISSNTIKGGVSGIALVGANYNTISGNVFDSLTSTVVYGNSTGVTYNTVTGNTFTNNSDIAVSFGWIAPDISQANNTISNNTFYNNGGSGTKSTIDIGSSSGTRVIGNSIIDTAGTGYAINISSIYAVNTYLSNNTYSGTGASAINDIGTGTTYADQANSSGSLIAKPLAGLSVGANTTSNSLTVQGSIKSTQLPTPSAPALTTSGTAGTTSYSYVVTALDGSGETSAGTTGTIATGNATLSSTNKINLFLPTVGGAVQYKIYRTASAGTPSTTGLIATVGAGTTTFSDTGLAASGSAPLTNTTGGSSFGSSVGISTLINTANAFTVQDAGANSIVAVSTNNYAGGANAADATLKVAKDSVTGRSINAAGTINASGADFAEYFYQAEPGILRPGDVVCLTGTQKVHACSGPDDALVGVVSTKPGYVGNDIFDSAHPEKTAPIAMLGQVPVKVSDVHGRINPGDRLTMSVEQPGYAVKATASGYILGVAMEAHGDSGVVQALIRPQYYTAMQNSANDYHDASFTSVNVGGLATLEDVRVTGTATIATLYVQRLIIAETLEINGHIISGGQAPTVASDGVPFTATVSGNDTAGTISFVAPANLGPGTFMHINFAKRYEGTPSVILGAEGSVSAQVEPYVDEASEQGFTAGSNNALVAGKRYRFVYHVIQ